MAELDPIEGRYLPRSGPRSVVAALRQSIIEGHYVAGVRLAEIPVAAELGVSRTPVRLAFRTLEQEGLLEQAGKRGYVVRAFSDVDVLCGVEVRGVLEGLAARRLAERGLDPALREQLHQCLAEGERTLASGTLGEDEVDGWTQMNERFHEAIVQASGSRAIGDAIARNNHLPFASANSIGLNRQSLALEYEKLKMAQMHHRLIVGALEHRESSRAEALMREHAYVGLRYTSLFQTASGSDPAKP